MMRIKLVLAALLLLLPYNIFGSEEDNSNAEIENLPNMDVSDGLVTEHYKTSEPAVKSGERKEDAELTDDYGLNTTSVTKILLT